MRGERERKREGKREREREKDRERERKRERERERERKTQKYTHTQKGRERERERKRERERENTHQYRCLAVLINEKEVGKWGQGGRGRLRGGEGFGKLKEEGESTYTRPHISNAIGSIRGCCVAIVMQS